MVFKKIKTLFGKDQNSNKDANKIAKKLDRILTENEMELEKAKEQVLGLEKQEHQEIKRLQQNKLSKKEEKFCLQKIQQLRKQASAIEERMSIYKKNIDLNLQLITKLQNIKAMELKGVEEDQIDEIFSEFELSLDTYMDTLKAAEQDETQMPQIEEKALLSLKQEILNQEEESSLKQEKESFSLSKQEEQLKKEIAELELEQ